LLCSKGHLYQSTPPHARCSICKPDRNRERDSDPYRQILHSARWQKTRQLVRTRDQNRFQLEEVGEPCGGAIQVHHIVGVRQGGAPFDPANWSVSAACITKTSSMGGFS
jgi:hypothetical protein